MTLDISLSISERFHNIGSGVKSDCQACPARKGRLLAQSYFFNLDEFETQGRARQQKLFEMLVAQGKPVTIYSYTE